MKPSLGNTLRFALHRLWAGTVAALLLIGLVEVAGPYVIDPSVLLIGDVASSADLREVRASLGLDKPWHERFVVGLGTLVGVSEARSYRFGLPVATLIQERWSDTLAIMVWAFSVALVLGTLVGLLSAKWKLIRDMVLRGWSMLLVVPLFVAASWVASHPATVNWPLPRGILAGAMLGCYGGIWFGQTIQAATATELASWHVKTLHALGMPRARILRTVLRGVLHQGLGVVDLFAAVLLTGGTVVVEYAFHIEGLGLLLLDSLLVMDIPIVRTLLAIAILSYIALSTLILVLRGLIDARVWEVER